MTPPMSDGSVACRADWRRDPTPNNTVALCCKTDRYSTTTSDSAIIVGAFVISSFLALWRLITNAVLTEFCTGRPLGLFSLRTRFT